MKIINVYEWIEKESSRKKILTTIRQPLTTRQICRKTGIPANSCSYTILKLVQKKLLTCLSPKASSNRLYALTELGYQYCERICSDLTFSLPSADVDWSLYAGLCFRHRKAVIQAMSEPMQPSEIRRMIRRRNPNIKISSNNTRDVMRYLFANGLVKKVYLKKKIHPSYELTETGAKFRELLLKAESIL